MANQIHALKDDNGVWQVYATGDITIISVVCTSAPSSGSSSSCCCECEGHGLIVESGVFLVESGKFVTCGSGGAGSNA